MKLTQGINMGQDDEMKEPKNYMVEQEITYWKKQYEKEKNLSKVLADGLKLIIKTSVMDESNMRLDLMAIAQKALNQYEVE